MSDTVFYDSSVITFFAQNVFESIYFNPFLAEGNMKGIVRQNSPQRKLTFLDLWRFYHYERYVQNSEDTWRFTDGFG